MQFFIEDSQLSQETDFKKIKEQFLKYFQLKTTLTQRQQLFSNCRQSPGESVRSFATKVSNLTAKYFGTQNISKADVAPILDQTKLAKFLEGLQPSLKNLAIHRNPTTFDQAVEQAQLDELNAQFTLSESASAPVNNFSLEPQTNLDIKLDKILEKQTEFSERLVNSLSEQIQNLQIQNSSANLPNQRYRRFNNPRSACIHCNCTNHRSFECYSLRNRDSYSHPHTSYPSSHNTRRGRPTNDEIVYQPRSVTPRDNQHPRNTHPKQKTPLNCRRGR